MRDKLTLSMRRDKHFLNLQGSDPKALVVFRLFPMQIRSLRLEACFAAAAMSSSTLK